MSRDGTPQHVGPADAAPDISNLAQLVGMVAHKYGRAIVAEASEYQRLVDLLPNAFEHGTEIRIRGIKPELRHRDSEIKRIVTAVETRDLRPCDLRPIVEQPHDDRDASKCSMRNQQDKTAVPFRSQRSLVLVDLWSSQFAQVSGELGDEIAFE